MYYWTQIEVFQKKSLFEVNDNQVNCYIRAKMQESF